MTDWLPLNLHAESALTQDLISSDPLSLQVASPSPLALFANPFHNGETEALFIRSPDNVLSHLQRTPAGWTLKPMSPGVVTTANEVVVAIAPDGVVWALYINPGDESLACAHLTETGWVPRQTGSRHWRRLKVVYSSQTPLRVPVVYGLDPQDNRALKLCYWSPFTSDWLTATPALSNGENFAGAEVLLYPISSDNVREEGRRDYRLFSMQPGTTSPGVYEVNSLVMGGDWAIQKLGNFTAIFPDQLIAASPVNHNLLVTAEKSTSQLFVFYSNSAIPSFVQGLQKVPGVSFKQAVAWLDADLFAHIYGITNEAGDVAVLHQTGWSSTIEKKWPQTLPTWTMALDEKTNQETPFAVPFEKNAALLFVDSFPASRPTVCVVKKNGELALHTQDLLTGRWMHEKVRLVPSPSQPPVEVSCYRTQVTLTDATGVALPSRLLRVTSSSLVQVRVGGATHLLAPGGDVELVTDRVGRATFCTVADGLTTPNLVINTPGLPSGVVVRPDAPVQNYLAGTGPLPFKEKLTGDVLKQSGVVPSWDKRDPDAVVKTFHDSFAIAAGAPPPRGVAGFMLQTSDPSQPFYRVFATREDLETAIAECDRHRYGGFIDDLGSGLADLWEGIRSGAVKIAYYAVDWTNRVLTLAVDLGTSVVKLGQFLLDSFKDAADAVMAVFNALGAGIEKVVDWLKNVFNFKDIWDTKSALEDAFLRFPDYLRDVTIKGVDAGKIKGWLDGQRDNIKTQLDAFDNRFAGKSFSDLPGWSDPNEQLLAPRRARFKGAGAGELTQGELRGPIANWMIDLILPYAEALPSPAKIADFSAAEELLVNAMNGVKDAFLAALKALADGFNALFNLDDPDGLEHVLIHAFVTLLKGFVDAAFIFLDAVITTLFEVIVITTRHAAAIMSAPIGVEPLQSLADWIQKSGYPSAASKPLSPAGLIALAMAFPVNFGAKLALGANTPVFPGGKLPDQAHVELTPGLSVPAGNLCAGVAGVIQFFYAVPDMMADLQPIFETKLTWKQTGFLDWWAVFSEAASCVLCWPTPEGIPFQPPKEPDPNAAARILNWAPTAFYPLADTFFVVTQDALARNVAGVAWGDLLKGLMTVAGVINIGGGAWESKALDKELTYYLINIMTPLSPALQCLRIGPPDPLRFWVKAVVSASLADIVAGVLRGTLNFAAT